jgi:hypothetical protein
VQRQEEAACVFVNGRRTDDDTKVLTRGDFNEVWEAQRVSDQGQCGETAQKHEPFCKSDRSIKIF